MNNKQLIRLSNISQLLPIFLIIAGINILIDKASAQSIRTPTISVPTPTISATITNFVVRGNSNNTQPSYLSVINNNGTSSFNTGNGSANILIPVAQNNNTVSTINVVFPSTGQATNVNITNSTTSKSYSTGVSFTPPTLD
jgi:hypothetical protein